MKFLTEHKWKIGTAVVVLILAIAAFSRSEAAEVDRAPLSVTQERVLEAGDTEFFYTYTNQRFNGADDGSHDFGGLWAPTNNVTLGASTVNNGGFGDTFLHGTARVGSVFGFEVRPSVGVSIPNGFTNNGPFFDTSSGTVDIAPAVTLVGSLGEDTGADLGVQWKGVFHLGENDFNFALGDQHSVTAWTSIQPTEHFSLYALARAEFTGSADGFVLAGNSEAISVGAGANVYVEGFRVSGEVAVPVHESYSGLRGGFDEARVFRVGVQRSF